MTDPEPQHDWWGRWTRAGDKGASLASFETARLPVALVTPAHTAIR